MKIPHQRYTEIGFEDVQSEIREFHAKQQYALLQKLKSRGRLLLGISPARLPEFIGNELEFWPGLDGEVDLPPPRRENAALVRRNSMCGFEDEEAVPFDVIAQFISDTLTYTEFDGVFRHRMYPSGGALYPVEVFLCRLSTNTPGWTEGEPVYHIRANSRSLEAMSIDKPDDLAGLRGCLSGYDESIGRPHFALVYASYIDKVIFKYKYRGYRNSLMEVGSMYQLCDLHSAQFSLRNRVWAGFHDGHVANKLRIDMTSVLPCVVQFFGK